MAAQARRQSVARGRTQITLTVLRTEWLSEHMVRLVAGGEGFADFQAKPFTDQYVKIHFPRPGVSYPEPLDVFALRETMPREHWPVTRTYTVRWVDAARAELAIDVVVHGDEGLAGPWAASAQPGEQMILSGPGGAYAPNPKADWHLLAGDESALPAIASGLEALPLDAQGPAFLEIASERDILELSAPVGLDLRWLVRGGALGGDSGLLARAIAAATWPEGRVHAFVHGERESVKAVRDVIFGEPFLLERSQVSISGYWAYGRTEDRFQAEKKDPLGTI